jgi:hypothetical protein
MRRLTLVFACVLAACVPTLADDDDNVDDDDATGDDDDDATGGDDDQADDDDAADDDDSQGDDDVADDDDSQGDDDDVCSIADFTLGLAVMAANGTTGQQFTPEDELLVAGMLTNPCPTEITFSTPSTCLLEPFVVTGADGSATGRGCGDAIRTFSIAAGGTLQDTMSVGMLPAGSYVFDAGFGWGTLSASMTFTVN